jgi:phage gpG-like protein
MATITLEEWAAHLRSVDLGAAITQAGITLALLGQRHAGLGVTDAPGGLRRQSSNLFRSINGTVKSVSGAKSVDVRLSAGGGAGRGMVKYAAIHEYGGTITAKRSKYLAIPIHPSLKTAAGIAKVPGPRSVPGLFFITSKKGNHLLVKSVGKNIEPWYLLRKSVSIPARPYMQPALEHIADKATEVLSLTITAAIQGDQ